MQWHDTVRERVAIALGALLGDDCPTYRPIKVLKSMPSKIWTHDQYKVWDEKLTQVRTGSASAGTVQGFVEDQRLAALDEGHLCHRP